MTEKEKMERQMLYDANNDKDLIEERAKAKDLCYSFSQLRPSENEKQTEIMKELLGKQMGIFPSLLPFGAITAAISALAKISKPITIR